METSKKITETSKIDDAAITLTNGYVTAKDFKEKIDIIYKRYTSCYLVASTVEDIYPPIEVHDDLYFLNTIISSIDEHTQSSIELEKQNDLAKGV